MSREAAACAGALWAAAARYRAGRVRGTLGPALIGLDEALQVGRSMPHNLLTFGVVRTAG